MDERLSQAKKRLRVSIIAFEIEAHIDDNQFVDAIVEEIRKRALEWERRELKSP